MDKDRDDKHIKGNMKGGGGEGASLSSSSLAQRARRDVTDLTAVDDIVVR